MTDYHYMPPTLAEACVQYVLTVPDMHAWSELCLDAVTREGAGPMLHAVRMWMPLGHHPDVRKIMVSAANARISWIQL